IDALDRRQRNVVDVDENALRAAGGDAPAVHQYERRSGTQAAQVHPGAQAGVGGGLAPEMRILSGAPAKHLGERAQEIREGRRPALIDHLSIERMDVDSDWGFATQI